MDDRFIRFLVGGLVLSKPKRAKPGVGRIDSDRERPLGYEHLGGHNSHRKRDLEKGAALTWAHAAAHLDRSPVTSDYFLR
jgi:hypothetical protein